LTIRSSVAERTEVLHGSENVMDTVRRFTSNANSRIDACVDYTRPSLAIEIEELKSFFIDAKKRGVKFRYVTEITQENIRYCKELVKMVDELRHLNGIKGNFYVSEAEYIAPARLHEKGKPATQIIYSNVKEMVEQQQYVFDSFWTRAIPAQEITREIEEGVIHHETKVIENSAEIIQELSMMTESSNELSTCITSGGLQYSYNHFFEIKKKLLEKQKKGDHKGIRYVSSIGIDDLTLAKIFLDSGIQIRHVKNLPPMSFGVSDKQMALTIEKMEGGRMVQSLLISNEPTYVNHFHSIFEELWKNGIDASDRIKDIEEGIDSQDIEIIQNPVEIQMRKLELVKSARNEILLLFSTANAFHRQERAGRMDLLNEAAARGVRIKVLTPMDDLIKKKALKLKQEKGKTNEIEIRNIEELSQTKVSIYVVDREFSLTIELKDDSKETSYESVGLSTYSNSKATVLSYVSIFESLWLQTELYENLAQSNKKLALANERLEAHDKMQNEFINIAAHELRSPIQPLLGLSEVLLSRIKDTEQIELLNVITRNAKRLQRLAEDILDVTRIEGQTLSLNKELFNLNDIIVQSIQDRENQIDKFDGNMKIMYGPRESDVFVVADRGRLTQVICNLLDNAIKFTNEGTISINLEKKDSQEVILSIKDTGTGIDSQLLPRLFSKFATKSELGGTGLGLFIAKSIIEAHGGKIWAENNADTGKGATFSVSLPILD
jgi:two-component system, OmpR family, sensor histidine kinase VicK